MSKKVLGILASPRQAGNCEMLLKEALLQINDTEKEIVRLHDLDIKFCRACYRCLPEGSTCVINDDFNMLIDKISAADGIILASPLYFLGPNASLKLLLDRFISMGTEGKRFYNKPCLTITTYGIQGWQGFGQVFSNLFAHFLTLDLKGSYLIKSAYPGEYMENEEILSKLKIGAANLFNPDYRDEPGSNKCPLCWNPYLEIREEGQVSCPSCGIKGKLFIDEGGKAIIKFEDNPKHRFDPDELHYHFSVVLQETVREFLAKRNEVKELQKKYRQLNW